ncbi:MAG TPA: histidine kinase [Gemmatimonadaceae bacterium]|nr:histidine kinase [Gemmatimonadaceae bacterium]
MSFADGIGNEQLLELFFSQSMDGFFFMMLDEPVEWNDNVDKEKVLDYVFGHQRMTKVNAAILTQFNASTADQLLGKTPADFFAHDLELARARWRKFFDAGYLHNETDERRLDGSPIRLEGDYMVIHDGDGRIAGHFGVQRDVTDRHLANEELRTSRQQLRALASRLQKVREEERTEVAREIHDELGQALTGLKLDMAWVTNRVPHGRELHSQCVSITRRIDQTINAVRRIATNLRPSVLDQLGLEAALEWQSQDFSARAGVKVTMESSVNGAPISDELGSSVFRIFQESLTNVMRHSQATEVRIKLVQTRSLLKLQLEDNGVGLQRNCLDDIASLGIVGMRERALACGGDLRITSGDGQGTRVLLTVPLGHEVMP